MGQVMLTLPLLLAIPSLTSVKAAFPMEVRQTSLPAPWVPFGCYSDNTTSRTLKIAATSDVTGMTIEECLAFCTPAGYKFAGVEFGRECYCDNVIEAPAVPVTDGCNMTCTGDSAEICGGSNRISIFQNASHPLPTGWVSAGCFTDNTTNRTLKTAATSDVTGMTIEECTTFCTPAGYQFAGVEFGRECYCDNIIESTGVPATDGCNMTCTGDSTEICGGSNRINILKNTAVSQPPPPPTATIKQIVGSFQYKGCFQDGVNGAARSLLQQLSVSGGVNAETCTAACKAAGFPLAGLEFGQECWCDTYMPFVVAAPDSDCNMPCQADATELCGSGNRLAVYQDTTAAHPNPTGCLTNAQFVSLTDAYFFGIQAVPILGGGPGVPLGAFEFPGDREVPRTWGLTFADGTESPVSTVFSYLNNTYSPNQLNDIGIPVTEELNPGSIQSFISFRDFAFTPTFDYCVMPNPVGLFGPFIGPPTLAVHGRNDQMEICQNAGVRENFPIYQPAVVVNQTCFSVVFEMVPPSS